MIQVQARRFTDDGQMWLSMLIVAMEDAARSELCAMPCARETVAALQAQLARPVPCYPQGLTHFSRFN
jgi:hypothetical protein